MGIIGTRQAVAGARGEAAGCASSPSHAWAPPGSSEAGRRKQSSEKITDALDAPDAYELWRWPAGKAPGGKG
jgi:hypothetical protein